MMRKKMKLVVVDGKDRTANFAALLMLSAPLPTGAAS